MREWLSSLAGGLRRLSTPSRIALGVVVLVLAGGAVAIVVNATSESESEEAAEEQEAGELGEEGEAEGQFAENALREVAKEGIEKRAAVFEPQGEEPSSGEAERGGPTSPAAQAVADRAYPRAYVDDRRATKTLKDFKDIPSRLSHQAAAGGASVQAAATASWQELGPFTPNVAGEASQFFDPDTLNGPATQETGRVNAMAIDPACSPGDCRMAVASAGGGVWHTDDALADHVQWQAPPNDLPTTAFGSIYYDAANNVLYAGSGEPNGSSDSEAGLGPVPVHRLRRLVVAGSRQRGGGDQPGDRRRSPSTRMTRTRSTSARRSRGTARPR